MHTEAKKELIALVRQYSNQVKNRRTITGVFGYLTDEVKELHDEVYTYTPGEDGIAGEAIDIILCCLDLIFLSRPDMTDQQILDYAEKKCEKWAVKYG
jgi:hypothetical protein